MLSQVIRHQYEQEVIENDVLVGPVAQWATRAESRSPSWQPLYFGDDLVLGLRPVAPRIGVEPYALGVVPVGPAPGRYRIRHGIGPEVYGVEVVIARGTQPPPASAPAAWYRIRFADWSLDFVPVLPRPLLHPEGLESFGRHVRRGIGPRTPTPARGVRLRRRGPT